jgi:hypothetical protein
VQRTASMLAPWLEIILVFTSIRLAFESRCWIAACV